MKRYRCIGLVLVAGLARAGIANGQAASDPPVFSIGQPPRYEFNAALTTPGRIIGEVYHPIINPLTGLLGVRGEVYSGLESKTTGVRAFAEMRVIGLSAGVDWNVAAGRLSPALSFQSAIRRGGIFGHGSMARVDWIPNGTSKLAIGVTVPLAQPLAGRTRPRKTHVDLSDLSSAAPARSLSTVDTNAVRELRELLAVVGAYGNVYAPRAENVLRANRRSYSGVLAAYDSSLRRLLPARVVTKGRQVIFDRIVLPIDTLFGQAKEPARDLSPLTNGAVAAFARWISDSSGLSADSASQANAAYRAWTDAIASVYADLARDAEDSRVVWLPVEMALTPDRFDEQAEVDSLIARAVGHPFTDQNALTYLRSSDLPLEIARSIYAAREYHVLWTHDFTGRRENGSIDNIGYSMVADAYLPALTAAVKRYDSTGVLPGYIILQDQFFYEPRDNRLWMTILENPLHASMRLKGDSGTREAHLLERQRELRAAVAASARLQRDASASGDADRWLRERVKVHVNIVEPSDFSFRSSRTIPGIPFTPDNVMRDHRKLVFYDLNESDPYRGALLIMGVGIGEHYASATWEDRGYRVRGPVTLDARRAVREALERNGFDASQIPRPLRAVESTKAVEAAANTRDYVGRALQVQNEAGFAGKQSSVARAMLYNLAPPGSAIIVPDPMWLSDTWAGMLAAAAVRGCKVYIVAPAAANAPSPQAPLMALQHMVLTRVLELQRNLAPIIQRAGGELRVGIFAAHAETDDTRGRAREIRDGLARAPWIRQLIPFDAHTLAVLEEPNVLSASGQDATTLAHDPKPRAPQLHQKAQLIARPGAIAALLRQPGWEDALARSLRAQTRETAKLSDQLGYSTPDVDTTATRRNDALFRGYERSVPEAERKRVSFYFSLGTQNQDTRGIVSDAETTLIVSGVQASAGLADLFTVMARSQWIDSEAQLSGFNGKPGGLMRTIAWMFRAAF